MKPAIRTITLHVPAITRSQGVSLLALATASAAAWVADNALIISAKDALAIAVVCNFINAGCRTLIPTLSGERSAGAGIES